jgi:hypothetical protein
MFVWHAPKPSKLLNFGSQKEDSSITRYNVCGLYVYIYICINMYIHIIYICMYKYVYTYIYMYTVYIYIYGSPNGTKLSGENDRNSAVKHRSVHTVSICVLEPWILTLSWKKKWKNFHHVLMDQLPSFATNYYLDLPWICMYIYIYSYV